MFSENSRSSSVIGILQEEQNLLSATKDLLLFDRNNRADSLLDILQAHNSKNEDYNLREVFELASKSTLDKMWEYTCTAVEAIAENKSYLVDDINMEVNDDLLSVEESFMADEKNRLLLESSQQKAMGSLNVLRAVSSIILVLISKASKDSDVLSSSAERKPSVKMFETLRSLHSMLFSLVAQSEEGEAVTVIIARCCERWWTRNFENKEELVTQLLPYLLMSAMNESSKTADLKRLNGVRHALDLLDFNHPSADTIKNLIIRCATTPLFLKGSKKKNKKSARSQDSSFIVDDNDDDDDNNNNCEEFATKSMSEGQRILSFALNLNANLAKEIWKSIKNGLKFQTKTIWSSYGTIIFRAWKACDDQNILDVIESNIIQDIMECGIKVADKTLFNACRTILQSFTFNKKQDGVDEMLLRLYNPILWRHLNAANHHVRSQATILLIDAFPLQDPSTTNEVIDNILTRQFNILERLLLDPVPKVRIIAIEGVCRILTMYWDLIPTRFTKKTLSLVVDRLSQDASSTSVRVSVLQSLTYLVTTNVLSHGAMRILLPRLRMRLHDTSKTVRQTFLELLLAVRDLKHIPFFDVAPLLHLHARLIRDEKHERLTSTIITLLIPTYYPQNERSSVQLERSTTLLMSYPKTALVFFKNLHLVIAVERVCKLILLFKRVLAVEILKLEQQEEEDVEDVVLSSGEEEVMDSDFSDGEEEEEISPTSRRKRARGSDLKNANAKSAQLKEASLRDIRLLLVAMRVLWGSVHDELILEEYTACNEQISSEFDVGGTKQFGKDSEMTYFERLLNIECVEDDQQSRSEIFCLCGYLPKDAVGDLKEEMFPMLYMLDERDKKDGEGGDEGVDEGVDGANKKRRESGNGSIVFTDKAFQDPEVIAISAANIGFERECIVRTLCNWGAGPQLVALATESLKFRLDVGKKKNKRANDGEEDEVVMRTKRSREDDGDDDNDTGSDHGEVDDDEFMPLTSAICVLEDSIAGNVANVRSNILSNRKWFTNLLHLTYSAKIKLDARLRESNSLALKSNEVSSDYLCRIFGLHCKLVVHGCALELIQEELEAENNEEKGKILYFPSPLLKMVGWATETVFRCQSNTTNTLGATIPSSILSSSRISNVFRLSGVSNLSSISPVSRGGGDISSVSNRLSGIGLHSIGSSPLPSGPRSRRRRSVGPNLRRVSCGKTYHSIKHERFTQLSRDVAVVITSIVADCALLGFKDKNNFVVSNVDLWENAFKKMLEEGGNNDKLKEQMKKLVKWCKKMKNQRESGSFSTTVEPNGDTGKKAATSTHDVELSDEDEEESDEDEDPFAEFERELEASRIIEEECSKDEQEGNILPTMPTMPITQMEELGERSGLMSSTESEL